MALVIHNGEQHEPEFVDQQMINNPEPCNFDDSDIERLKLKGSFPPGTIFRPYDPDTHADYRSNKWVCFPEFPFSIGIKYPFSPLFNDFFATTELCYSQTMPMIWRTLSVIQTLVDFHDLDLGIPKLAQTYNLRSHGSHYFLFQIKPHRSHLVLRATQNDPKWKGRFFFVARSSLPDGDSIPSIWIPKVNFAELAPPQLETEANLRKFLEIPASERTFKHPHSTESIGSRESETTMSAHFTLSDIDIETPIVKKEKTAPESSKPRMPNLRSKSAKKRKNNEVIELDDSAFDVVQAAEQFIKCYQEKVETIEEMRRLSDVRIAAHEKDAAELVKSKKEVKELKSSITKKFAEADAKVVDMKKVLVSEIKRDAAIAVLEARILMASEAASKGYDTSMWAVATWKAKLANLKGVDPDTMTSLEDTAGKAPKADKAPKQPPSKAPQLASDKAPKADKAPRVEDTEDVVMAEQDYVADVLKDLAAVEDGSMIPGDEGINDQPEPGL